MSTIKNNPLASSQAYHEGRRAATSGQTQPPNHYSKAERLQWKCGVQAAKTPSPAVVQTRTPEGHAPAPRPVAGVGVEGFARPASRGHGPDAAALRMLPKPEPVRKSGGMSAQAKREQSRIWMRKNLARLRIEELLRMQQPVPPELRQRAEDGVTEVPGWTRRRKPKREPHVDTQESAFLVGRLQEIGEKLDARDLVSMKSMPFHGSLSLDEIAEAQKTTIQPKEK